MNAVAHDKDKGGVLVFQNQCLGTYVYVLVKSYDFLDICSKFFPAEHNTSLVFEGFDQTCTSAEEFNSKHGFDPNYVFYAQGGSVTVMTLEEDKSIE